MSTTKLSDRVRPGSEAAPWVIDEIKKLEAALEVFEHTRTITRDDQLAQARAAIVDLAITAEFIAECAGFGEAPTPNCRCFMSAPCSDCTTYSVDRDATKALEDARSKPIVQEALAEWRKSISP